MLYPSEVSLVLWLKTVNQTIIVCGNTQEPPKNLAPEGVALKIDHRLVKNRFTPANQPGRLPIAARQLISQLMRHFPGQIDPIIP